MSSTVIIKVKCEVYLIRFLEKLFGEQPISFPRKHDFNNILDFLLAKPPMGHVETDYGEKTLRIQLPYFEDKDIRSYNYLSAFKQGKLEARIAAYFKVVFHAEINKLLNLGFIRKDAIEIFMDEYNLPIDCLDLLEKDYSRYLTVRWKRRLFRSNKNSSVTHDQNGPSETREEKENSEKTQSRERR
jgi:hypothetical protein